MNNVQSIVRLMIQKLKTMPNGSESTVSDMLYEVLRAEDGELSIEELFEIDSLFRRKAIDEGIVLDSMKHDFNPGLPLDRSFVVRRI